MKKMMALLLAAVVLLAGCGAKAPSPVAEITPVAPRQVNAEEAGISGVDGGEVHMSEFAYAMQGKKAYGTISTWLEVYVNGEKREDVLNLTGPGKENGSITLYSNANLLSEPFFELQLDGQNGGTVNASGGDIPVVLPSAASASAWLDASAQAPLDQEVVLAAYYYTDEENATIYAYDVSYLTKNPDTLKDAQCVLLLKCKFTE